MESIVALFDYLFNQLTFDNIANFIFHPEFTGFLLFVKIIFIIISAVLIINIFYLIALSSWMSSRYTKDWREFKGFESIDAQDISKKWEVIKKRIQSGKDVECKLAVIESEESLINTLRMMGFDGPTFEDQIRQAGSDDISNIKEVLEAHNIRNSIVNSPEKEITLEQAKKAVSAFEQAFEDLQA
jgi:uncharacterized membrane protein